MEQTADIQSNKFKYAATYGFYLGLYIALFYILGFLFPKNTWVSMLSSLAWIGLPFMAGYLVKRYRDIVLKAYMTYGQAWRFGVWLFVFASLIMAVVHYVHFEFLQPDFIVNAYNQALLMMEEMELPQSQIDAFLHNDMPSPIQITFIYIWTYIIGGAFLFLFISIFLVKKDWAGI